MTKLLDSRARAIIFFCALAIMAGINFVQYRATEDTGLAVDFPSFYYASKLVFEDGLTPYNSSNWRLVKPLYTAGELSPFLYPPPSLLIFRPFALFSYESAKSVMLWLNQFLILPFIFLFYFKILKPRPQDLFLTAAVIYLYSFNPLLVTLNNGQVSLWVLVSICLAWWATKEKMHPVWIALPLAFAIILKLFPILLLAIYFFKKDTKTIVYVLILLVVVSLIAALLLPGGIWQDWFSQVASRGYAQDVGGMAVARPANQSIHAFVARLFYGLNVRFAPMLSPPSWAGLVPYILGGLVGLLSIGATWWISRNKIGEPDKLDLQFCIWLPAIFLVSPFSWQYHLVHLLPAIYLAVLWALKGRNALVKVLIIGLALFLAYDFPFNSPLLRNGAWTLLYSSPLYAVGLLWLYFIFLTLRNEEGDGLLPKRMNVAGRSAP